MSIWSDWFLPRLMDCAVLSTVFLALMLTLRLAVRRPGARVMLGWGAMLGLLVLTIAPWFLPRLSIVPRAGLRMDGRSAAAAVEAAPSAVVTPMPTANVAAVEPPHAPQSAVSPPSAANRIAAGAARPPLVAATKNKPTPSFASATPQPTPASSTWLGVNLLTCAAIVWLVAAGTTCGWIVAGGWRVRRILSHAVPAPEWMVEQLRELDGTAANRTRRSAGIKLSGDVVTAVAMNAWHPCILLPADSEHLTDRQLVRLALAHEAAHIRQGDLWLLAIERTLLPLYFLQPLFWIWRWLLRGDQELLADAAASADDPVAYADALVAWARSATEKLTRSHSPFNTLHALSLFDNRPPLTRRIDMLLDPTAPRPRPVSRRASLAAACAFLTIAGGLSLFSLQPAAAQPTRGAASETAAPASAAQADAAAARAAARAEPAAKAEAARQAEVAARQVAQAEKPEATSDSSEEVRLRELELRTATLELQRAEERYRTYQNGRNGDEDSETARSARSARDNAALAVERAKLAMAVLNSGDEEQLAIEGKLLELDLREAKVELDSQVILQKNQDSLKTKGVISEAEVQLTLAKVEKAKIAVERAELKYTAHVAQRRAAATAVAAAKAKAASRPRAADGASADARVEQATAVEEQSKATQALQGYWEKKTQNGVPLSTRSLVYVDRAMWSTVPLRNNDRHPKLRVKLNESRNPIEIDLSTDYATTRGLLKLDGDELTLCLGAANAPRPSAFKSGANPFPQLLVFRRARTEDARIISRVGTFNASVLILNDGRAISVTPETKFVRQTKDGEQPMAAEDLRDDDVVIFDSHQLADPFVRRIVVMKEADLLASPNSEFSADLIDTLRAKGLEWCVSLLPRSDSRSDRAGGGAGAPRMSGGGGVFVDERGYVLAPLGTVDGGSSITVLTGNTNGGANPFSGFGSGGGGFNNPVTFLARDPKQNLALLQVGSGDRRSDPRHGSVRWAEKPAAVGETVLPVTTNIGRSAAAGRITPLKVVAVDREALVNGVMLRGLIELEPSAALSGSLLLNANSEAVGLVMNATDGNPAPIFAVPAAAAGKFVQEAVQTAKPE